MYLSYNNVLDLSNSEVSTQKLLMLISAPKTGSTWLSAILIDLLGWKGISLVPEYGRREQEIDCQSFQNLVTQGGNYLAISQHLRNSRYTRRFIDAVNANPVILYRDIFDTVVSKFDHMNRESTIFPMAYMNEEIWSDFSDEKKMNFIIDMIVPWYFNFYAGWLSSSLYKENRLLLLSYEDMNQNIISVLKNILHHISEERSDESIEKSLINIKKNFKTRKNVGFSGEDESFFQIPR